MRHETIGEKQAKKERIMLDALQEIAHDFDCQGPRCIWCNSEEHPPSYAAKIAQKALEKLKEV